MKSKKILAVLMCSTFLICNINTLAFAKSHNASGELNVSRGFFDIFKKDKVTFKDIHLENAIREEIHKFKGDLTKSDLRKITKLEAENKNISDLGGLENLTNLKDLWLGGNHLKNIEPLANLTKITRLNLGETKISDLTPLKNLTKLNYLFLDHNLISDLTPLRGLNNLIDLRLQRSEIKDITPLEDLTNLRYLYLDFNHITNIEPLKKLINLKILSISYNKFDISNDTQLCISKEDRDSLVKALPKCDVSFY